MRSLLAFLLIITKVFILLSKISTTTTLVVAIDLARSDSDNSDQELDWRDLPNQDGPYYHESPSLASGQRDNIATSSFNGGPMVAKQVIRTNHGPSQQQLQDSSGHQRFAPLAGLSNHLSSKPLDDGAIAIVSDSQWAKTNSLIESVSPKEQDSSQTLDQFVSLGHDEPYDEREEGEEGEEEYISSRNERHKEARQANVDDKNIDQTTSVSSQGKYATNARQDNHESSKGGQKQHKNDWCRRDCNIITASNGSNFFASSSNRLKRQTPICASDGRLYGSLCELRRHSCQHNTHLLKRPHAYCRQQRQIATLTSKRDSNWSKDNVDHIRVVELKKRCHKSELDEMKLLLLREFNGDIESMFRYYDTNGDGLIEAHELWPRRDLESNRILYAQVWNEHNSQCPSATKPANTEGYPSIEDHTKCWYFVDFAFEPQFESNPCSLSHLMLFDLKQANHIFTIDTFQLAFSTIKSKAIEANRLSVGPSEPIKKVTQIRLNLGDSVTLECMPNKIDGLGGAGYGDEYKIISNNQGNNIDDELGIRCLWTRYNVNMAAIRDAHISVGRRIASANDSIKSSLGDSLLHIEDAQLYLSGVFKCSCHIKQPVGNFEHLYSIQVLAQPRVDVTPHYQWSLPGSRVSFECHYDYIDTSFAYASDYTINNDKSAGNNRSSRGERKFDSDGQFGLRIRWLKNGDQHVVDSKYYEPNDRALYTDNSATSTNLDESVMSNAQRVVDHGPDSRASRTLISPTSARASITIASSRLTLQKIQLNDTGLYSCQVQEASSKVWRQNVASDVRPENILKPSDSGAILLVQDQPKADQSGEDSTGKYLWMFHENGISVYRFQSDDSQEMELVSEINGHSLVNPDVDGNWNQLTLCGGLNPEQVVICEWSDNAIYIDVDNQGQSSHSKSRSYIYVGQPNLNRIAVFDGSNFEIVAIINTEPQPRKLFLYKPNKVHLSKWVRRHLSPSMNARWLSAIGRGQAHPLRVTPESELYSQRPQFSLKRGKSQRVRERNRRNLGSRRAASAVGTSSNLIQYDIWLLCYGQPLVVDPSGDERLNDPADFYAAFNVTGLGDSRQSMETIQPFTPRLAKSLPFSWSLWSNKEALLRNRKSVHIIQSTFFPKFGDTHNHNEEEDIEGFQSSPAATKPKSKDSQAVKEFKKSTVITTHHIFPGLESLKNQPSYLSRDHFDLIHDLVVPSKPYSFQMTDKHKTHYAYVTHYGERRLFRVSMDEYRYDQDIDLQNCDPINMKTTPQGLLVIQCRAPISHNLIGQLVLDQLTSARIEFNADVRAQDSYLSPDSRYLVSIYSNSTPMDNLGLSNEKANQAIIYVQLVTVSGLKLQYEIKTLLEISQCSFVWKNGYYNAIFLSTNRRDQQSEILSLRLVDSRLELMARVPGIISSARHKKQLIVSPELRVAALSTNQGTFVVDLEDNRVSQSLRRHQSPPTLLWV